jgi:hypothetical protein
MSRSDVKENVFAAIGVGACVLIAISLGGHADTAQWLVATPLGAWALNSVLILCGIAGILDVVHFVLRKYSPKEGQRTDRQSG